MSPSKEPHYFALDISDFKRNPDRFRIKDEKSYLELFKDVKDEIAIGEASTTYLRNPTTPQRIHNKILRAKIIIILRDPIDQFVSGHFFNLREGWLKSTLHEHAQQRCGPVNKRNIKSNGLSVQVKRYFDIFGPKQVKIIIFEDFVKNVKETVEEVLRFLGIQDSLQNFDAKVHNPSIREDDQKLSPNDREMMIKFFRKDVEKLEIILKHKLPWPNFQNELS